jgi:hypothetical protein
MFGDDPRDLNCLQCGKAVNLDKPHNRITTLRRKRGRREMVKHLIGLTHKECKEQFEEDVVDSLSHCSCEDD